MLTDEQREVFSEILNLNWEFEQTKRFTPEKIAIGTKLSEKKAWLKNSMGEDNYNNFIEQGRKMFAPKK